MITSELKWVKNGKRVYFHYVYISKFNFICKLLKGGIWFIKSHCGDDYISIYQYVFTEDEIVKKTDFMKKMQDHEWGHVKLYMKDASREEHDRYDLRTLFGLLQR